MPHVRLLLPRPSLNPPLKLPQSSGYLFLARILRPPLEGVSPLQQLCPLFSAARAAGSDASCS